jgi:hypothetical protein
MSRIAVAVLGIVAIGCASAPPRSLGEALARVPAAQPQETTRTEEELVRRTLASAIAAGNVPSERPLVLLRSPFGSARVLPRGTGATFVLLDHAEISRLAAVYGTFVYLHARITTRDASRMDVEVMTLPATPPADAPVIILCCYGQGDVYEKRDGAWVLTSSVRFDI